MKSVKILGSGCANCRKLEAVAREAATSAGIESLAHIVGGLDAADRHDAELCGHGRAHAA